MEDHTWGNITDTVTKTKGKAGLFIHRGLFGSKLNRGENNYRKVVSKTRKRHKESQPLQ